MKSKILKVVLSKISFDIPLFAFYLIKVYRKYNEKFFKKINFFKSLLMQGNFKNYFNCN